MSWAQILSSRSPRPNLIGLELEPFPFASAFSMLLRVSRLMSLDTGEWSTTLGLPSGAGAAFLMTGLPSGRISRQRFEEALGLTNTQVPLFWTQEAWSPIDTRGLLDRVPSPVRWCWDCAKFGYHTALFQLPTIRCCPWHGSPLQVGCPLCAQRGAAVVDRQGRLGFCECGFDWFKVDRATIEMWSFPTEKVEAWLSRYLAWATEQRRSRTMVTAGDADAWLLGFTALAQPPPDIGGGCGVRETGTTEKDFGPEIERDPPAGDFWGWSALADERPLSYVSLPPTTLDELSRVAREVVSGLPRRAQTPLELAAFSGLDPTATLGENAAERPDCFIAPHGRKADGSTWLNLSAVDGRTLQLCGNLVDGVVRTCDQAPVDEPRSRQAARAAAMGRIAGRGRLYDALLAILSQGYSQGLEAVLRASLELPRAKVWRLPVVEFECHAGNLARVRVSWVPVAAPRLARPAPASSAPTPPSQKAARAGRSTRRRRSRGKLQARGKSGRK